MKLGKMNNTNLCGTSNTSDFGDCDWLMYAESISLQAIIPIILGIIAFPFACIIVWSARMCCCGGNKPSKGLCCGSTDSWNVEKDGYTSSEVMLIVIILVAAAAVFLGLMSYGIVADNDLSNHVTDFILTMKNTSDHLKESLDTIESAIKDIDSGSKGFLSSDLNSFTGDINAYLDDFANFMDSTKSTVDKVNGYRHNFMFSTFIGPAILCILAVIGGLIGFPLLSFP